MAAASADIPVFCGASGVSNISVSNPLVTSLYTWSTTDGHIVGDSVGPSITIDQTGSYIVSQQLMDSCGSTYARDTVLITADPGCSLLATLLQNFSGRLVNDKALLSWSVSNQAAAFYYEVERSDDNGHFNRVARLYATDHASEWVNYQYSDDLATVKGNLVFYRIKTVDKGGRAVYSRVVAISLQEGSKTVLLMPNPVSNRVQLLITGDRQADVAVIVLDLFGHTMRSLKATLVNGTSLLDITGMENWPRGTYIVKVAMAGKMYTEKMVLVR
jgi:hypothetical protein